MPRRLPESYKRQGMDLLASMVGLFGPTHLRLQVRMEQSRSGFFRFEHHGVQKHFAAVCPDHPHRCDLSSFFAYIKIWRTIKVYACVCKIDGALGVVRKFL